MKNQKSVYRVDFQSRWIFRECGNSQISSIDTMTQSQNSFSLSKITHVNTSKICYLAIIDYNFLPVKILFRNIDWKASKYPVIVRELNGVHKCYIRLQNFDRHFCWIRNWDFCFLLYQGCSTDSQVYFDTQQANGSSNKVILQSKMERDRP